jgi:hypothetical protein
MEKTEGSEKLFGKYHELTMLIIGFALTTIVGGAITAWHQSLAQQREEKAVEFREQQKRTSDQFDLISGLMDERLFRLRNVEGALADHASPLELDAARAKYKESVSRWNENLGRNIWATERYFGAEIRNQFEGPIKEGFRSLHEELVEVIKTPNDEDKIKVLKTHIDEFNPKVYSLEGKMLDILTKPKPSH